jgi:hypothetical protein
MCVSQLLTWKLAEEIEVLGKLLRQYYFVHESERESNLDRRGANLMTNSLSCSTATYVHKSFGNYYTTSVGIS